jgi:8-oxo-dGTP pyrophosphatase MutT (NUDIX family)
VLVAQEGRVLLGKRSSKSICPGLWCLPCGFVEYEEDFLTAAVREVREETGLSVALCSIINVAHNFLPDGVQTLVPVLLAEVAGGVARAGDDVTELRWFGPDDELPEMAFESDRYIVVRYHAGETPGLPIDERYRASR